VSTPPLREAYATARYRIDCGTRTIERRVGRLDADADAALAAAGCVKHWHVLTPCNPGSQPLSDDDNRARVAALHDELVPRGWTLLSALNTDADGRWPEPGFCIFDAPEDLIRSLARDHGQLAIVGGTLGAVPQLVWIDDAE
jgi:hypothetical protein